MTPQTLFLALFSVLSTHVNGLSCLGNDGKAVDWSFTYKMPNGYQIAYTDSGLPASRTGPLKLFERALDDTSNPPGLIRTLLGLESSHDSVMPFLDGEWGNATNTSFQASSSTSSGSGSYLLYNDEPDDGPAAGANYGHTKGVVHVASDGGFWLVHSTPKWPLSTSVKKFYFPEGETKFGQTFLCISLSKSEIDTVAKQLLYNTPYVYHSTITAADKSAHPALGDVLDKNWVKDAGSNIAKISSTFTSYAKNAAWNQDLWEDLVAADLKSDFMVETWIRGHKLGSYCKPKYKYEVVDVKSMKTGDVSWTEEQDHAKWGVALDGSNTVCVGDINRMATQRSRGGGAVCFVNSGLSNQLYNTVDESFQCSK